MIDLGSDGARRIRVAQHQDSGEEFCARFRTREQVERYRARYTSGRRRRVHLKEEASLAQILAGLRPVETVLDMPCGTGRLAPLFAKIAERIILADASSVMLEVAREEHPHLQAQYLLTRAERIELADGSVDIAFCHRLLHHIRDRALRARILGELARVSKQYVILSYFPSGFRTRIRWWLRRLLGMAKEGTGPVSQRAFFEEAASHGLRLVRAATIRRFPSALFCQFERA
jgi:ubiquinone/menaquinone biosynthesis C-methylase UbiE